jgi:hypothetical protein
MKPHKQMLSMKDLIEKLEMAILKRNPKLAERLQPGLGVEKIKKDLKRAGIAGAIDPIIELYSWHDGTNLQGSGAEAVKPGFVPPVEVQLSDSIKQQMRSLGIKRDTASVAYNFVELKMTILYKNSFEASEKQYRNLSIIAGRYFPFLWDGSSGFIAVDLDALGNKSVVTIQRRDDQPLREAYDTFEDFLKDAIRANENNEPLTCIRNPGKPITEALQSHPELSAKIPGPVARKIPATENPLVLRTDFSDERMWKSLCKALQDPEDEFSPELDLVSDPAFNGIAATELSSLVSESSSHTFAFIVDRAALTQSGNPILAIDLHDKPGRTFRVIASAVGEVANNLSIANMDFDEFAEAVDKDSVYRGARR